MFVCVLGVWHKNNRHDDELERIILDGNLDTLSITWKAEKAKPRELDWAWGGHKNVFSLAGGSSSKILRWRPSTRHFLFDDDHIVWVPFDTNHEQVQSEGIIIYTHVRRFLKHFQDIDPIDWCA